MVGGGAENRGMELALIPRERYADYRYEVIFKGYKWDPQVEDHNTVARHALLLDSRIARQLGDWAERLAGETVKMEEAFSHHLSLAGELGFPGKINRALGRLEGYRPDRHVRLMRFDFHPTATGWAVSEVNSDVPGGFAEASVLPQIASRYFGGHEPWGHAGRSLWEAFQKRIRPGGTVAFVHATSYSDDRQVMEFLSDFFQERGLRTIFAAPDHLAWRNKRAVSLVAGREGEVDGIVRFFPLEWLANLPRRADWKGYYDCETPSCNHPIAIFAQSKRLPLVWDRLGVDIPAWKELLPETRSPKGINPRDTGWIYKPALGRVGEGISIPEAAPQKEIAQIEKAVRRRPKDWIAQKRFHSQPLVTTEGVSYHLCVGAFTIDGKCAGFYGRISPYARIDSRAEDIPLLVSKDGMRDV